MTSVRMDKWLWAARFFKTRALAARACDRGRIQSNGQPAKPAREVRIGDMLRVKFCCSARSAALPPLPKRSTAKQRRAASYVLKPQRSAKRHGSLNRSLPEDHRNATAGRSYSSEAGTETPARGCLVPFVHR
jgi:ribosomal 50S subunit-recycling heat shock protein